MLYFASDYQEGALPEIMTRLTETNLQSTPGYGSDDICASAREKIRAACACPDAAVHFLVGGTQTNATVIDAMLRSYQGVIAAETGHIASHESGAIEFGGHKVLTLPHTFGKLSAKTIEDYCKTYWEDANCEHMVVPGMVYLSQPTEYGTLYSLAELEAIHAVCQAYHMPLYVDGARLAYALACKENDVTLPDLARLCDAFYIGGTKCGALFGEAVVFPNPSLVPHFFTIVKQHGALLAKGRLLGLQFDTLFTDSLYFRLGKTAIDAADRLRAAFDAAGYRQTIPSPTNQIFIVLENEQKRQLEQHVSFGFWEKYDDRHTVVRVATSWATTPQAVDAFCALLS